MPSMAARERTRQNLEGKSAFMELVKVYFEKRFSAKEKIEKVGWLERELRLLYSFYSSHFVFFRCIVYHYIFLISPSSPGACKHET